MFCDFSEGGGVLTPGPPSGSAHGYFNMRWSEIKINQENAVSVVQDQICTCFKENVGSDLKPSGKRHLYSIMF